MRENYEVGKKSLHHTFTPRQHRATVGYRGVGAIACQNYKNI